MLWLPVWCCLQKFLEAPAVWGSKIHHWRGSRDPSPLAETCSNSILNREREFKKQTNKQNNPKTKQHTPSRSFPTCKMLKFMLPAVVLPWWHQFFPTGFDSSLEKILSCSPWMESSKSFLPFHQEFLKDKQTRCSALFLGSLSAPQLHTKLELGQGLLAFLFSFWGDYPPPTFLPLAFSHMSQISGCHRHT